jgi:hypothetical protein
MAACAPRRLGRSLVHQPPYTDARPYSRIDPDRYVEWFLPFGEAMLADIEDAGWLVLNIKNRVTRCGPYKGQQHPYVHRLVLALQEQGWRWIETYIWSKPNAIPGRFGPRTKDSFEYVYAFAKHGRPYFDLDTVRVPCRTAPEEIERRRVTRSGGGAPVPGSEGTGRRRTCSAVPTPVTS